MADERTVTEAKRVARDGGNGWARRMGYSGGYSSGDIPDAIVDALHAAGMLASPLHRRALEACEVLAKEAESENRGRSWYTHGGRPCVDVGRESLAAKEPPKPAWKARKSSLSSGEWFVEPEDGMLVVRTGRDGLTEAQAKAVAAALNALDAESPR